MTALRLPAPAPFRLGLVVLDRTGRPVGGLMHDDRQLHAAACRASVSCSWSRYDDPSLADVARELADHLTAAHGVRGLTLDFRGQWRSGLLDRTVRQVRTGWDRRRTAA